MLGFLSVDAKNEAPKFHDRVLIKMASFEFVFFFHAVHSTVGLGPIAVEIIRYIH